MAPSHDEYLEAARFRIALRRFLADADADVRASGLTPQRYLLLLVIKGCSSEGMTMTELMERLQLAQSTVTELVDRAESSGLVRRSGTEDGRVVQVKLTKRGERFLEKAFLSVRDDRERLLSHLPRSRRRSA
jgi:DNA-binding MarR family transcriptional regulator